MTTGIQDAYQFHATVKGLGIARQGDGWMMTLDWKLPDSKFELNLYGKNWDDIEDYAVGQASDWTIYRGNLKSGKEGRYTSDYYWDLGKPGQAPPVQPQTRQPNPANQHSPMDVQTRIEIGMAFKAACTLITHLNSRGSAVWDMTQLRELRDTIYHEVIQVPIAEAHYCYDHEQPRLQGQSGRWGHKDGDGWCLTGDPNTHDPEPASLSFSWPGSPTIEAPEDSAMPWEE